MDITSPLEAVVQTVPDTPPGATAVARISLHGRIDRDGDAVLGAAYRAVTELDAPVVHLDFDGVGYINSTGIALIVRLLAEARRDRREVRASGLSEHYREIFRITRLSDFMTLVGDDNTSEGARA